MEDIDIPENILAAANIAKLDLLPDKSKIHYEKEYLQFCEWRNTEQVHGAGEAVLLAYFVKLSNEFSPSSLWPKYSMLRACLELKERVEINKYGRTNELTKMLMDNVEILESKLVITIPDSKTHKERFFAVISDRDVNPMALFKKYIALRPAHTPHRRLFLSYI
ncbi:hypothetical protein QE152_g30384 [Popillia japonica]|uniref:Uncharacterized protein n=1 Tax=Popillia japonica TaxID=7064 RepID=A0AAW1JF44_POPJA